MSEAGSLDHFRHYQAMREKGIVMAFLGSISQEVLVGLAEGLREMLEQRAVARRVTRKVFAILVELAQNISAYSLERDRLGGNEATVGVGMLMVTENALGYCVSSGNLTGPETSQGVMARVMAINAASPEELRGEYRTRLREPRRDGKETAGVGLVQVALHAGRPLDCRTEHVDAGRTFVVISATVLKEDQDG